jgi:hypothetical protein
MRLHVVITMRAHVPEELDRSILVSREIAPGAFITTQHQQRQASSNQRTACG